MLKRQFDELKLTGCLPSPSGVGLLILQQTRGDDYTLADLSRTLAADPTLTGRILRLANSSALTGVELARTAHQAAVRLGVRALRNVALGFTLVSGHRKGSCRNFDYEHYWSHSLAVAAGAQALAARIPGLVPSEAFTFGLLAGIGRLALASIHPERYADVLARVRGGDVLALARAEREAFGLDHGELCAAMFEDWHLPDEFLQAVLACCESECSRPLEPGAQRLAGLTLGARALADELTSSGEEPAAARSARDERLAALRSDLGLRDEDFALLREQVGRDWREWARTMNVPLRSSASEAEPDSAAPPAAPGQAAAPAPSSAPAGLRRPLVQSEDAGASAPAAAAPASADETLPTDATAGPASGSAPRAGVVMRVLVVEDDPVSRRLLCFHLAREGHLVESAGDGREGLAKAVEHCPHLLVTDWNMPEMDGIELVRALRRTQEGRHLQVILLTGREEESRVIEAFDAGADEYLTKPLNPRILLARVRSAQRVMELREQVRSDAELRNRQLAEQAVLNRKLQMAALTDPLTELPNRRHALDRLQQELATAMRDGTPLSLIMIDIDRFKQVNDVHGHDAGDEVLKSVARCLRDCVRVAEVVCRIGGEEFLVLCPRASSAKALLIAERMRLACEANVIEHGTFRGAVTLSLGVAELDRADPSVDRLVKVADERAYLAKRAGRNRVVATDGGEGGLRAAG